MPPDVNNRLTGPDPLSTRIFEVGVKRSKISGEHIVFLEHDQIELSFYRSESQYRTSQKVFSEMLSSGSKPSETELKAWKQKFGINSQSALHALKPKFFELTRDAGIDA